jgi:molybdenum cofactor biosynthesis protein B
MTTSSERHKAEAVKLEPVAVALLTVSDTRTEETDSNGRYLQNELEDSEFKLCGYEIIKDEPDQVLSALKEFVRGPAQVVLINGGTGISQRDTTIDALDSLFERTLPGFGELFRSLSYQEIGSAAMLSRAAAGVFEGCIVFVMPGSTNAVKLAWEKLIKPELQHLAYELQKQ